MILQTEPYLGAYMNKYACLFMDIAYARTLYKGYEWTKEELKALWMTAISSKLISGDTNRDGDMDDKGELEIQSHSRVAVLLQSPIIQVGGHFSTKADIGDRYAIGCFYNPRTGFRHFAVLDNKRRVIYDSLGSSVTIREGYLESLRLYKVVVL